MSEPTTGRTTDHANKLDSSHAGEHGRRWRLSLEFGAADDAQAARLADAWADTAAREWSTRNPIVTSVGGEQRDRIAAILVARRTNGLCPLNGPCEACDCFDPDHRHERDDADAVVAALPELAELDRLRAKVTAYRAAAQSTDLEGDVRDHLHGLADWDTPGGAVPEWLVDAVIGFVAPHVAERDRLRAELQKADTAELKRTKALLKMAERHAMNCDANQAAAEAAQARAEARYAGLNAFHLRTVADYQAEMDALRQRAERAVTERDTAQAAITRAREHLAKLIELGQFTEKATVAEIVPLLHHLDAALTPPSAPESTEDDSWLDRIAKAGPGIYEPADAPAHPEGDD